MKEQTSLWQMVADNPCTLMKEHTDSPNPSYDFVRISTDATPNNLYHYSYVIQEATVEPDKFTSEQIAEALDAYCGYKDFNDLLAECKQDERMAYGKLAQIMFMRPEVLKEITGEFSMYDAARKAVEEKLGVFFKLLEERFKNPDKKPSLEEKLNDIRKNPNNSKKPSKESIVKVQERM